MKKTLILKRTLIVILCALASICFIGAFAVSLPATAEEKSSTYMEIESTEMEFSNGMRGSSGNGLIYGNGTLFESFAMPVMTVWHFPKEAEVQLDTIVRKHHLHDGAQLNFRIVHEHAKTGINEVVYPASGGWFNLNSVSINDAGTAYKDTHVDGYLNMHAGDKLKMIVQNADNGSWVTAYVTGGIKFLFDGGTADGVRLYNNSPSVDYANSDTGSEALPEELQAYYGLGATKSDAITYEYVTSFEDIETGVVLADDYFDYFDQKICLETLQTVRGSFSGKNQNVNWTGSNNLADAKYIAYDVKNNLGGDVLVGAEILTSPSGNSEFYGGVWSVAEYLDYYLIDDSTGEVTKHQLSTTNYQNLGGAKIKDGFSGTVIFPVESFEKAGYRFGTGIYGYDSYDSILLDSLCRFDNLAFSIGGQTYSSTGTLEYTNLRAIGSNIKSLPPSSSRAIQAIRDIGTVNAGSENLIAYARSTYDALSATEQEAVTNYQVLVKAEQVFASFEDYSYVLGTDGKDFNGASGVEFNEVFDKSPVSLSAWIKVSSTISDEEHIGTVLGHMWKEDQGSGNKQGIYENYNAFAFEIATNGNPRLTWRVSASKKVVFTVNNVDVRTDKWMHVAFVRNVENNALQCFINGVLANTMYVREGEIDDINMIKPVTIGTDYTDDFSLSPGENPNFKGYIANAKLYSTLLNESTVLADLKDTLGSGLLGAIDFRSGEVGTYYNHVGEVATDAHAWVSVSDDYFKADSDEYTFAVLGDTQMMLSRGNDGTNTLYNQDYDYTTNVFYKNIQWLINNKENLNLKFTMHMGDLTDNLNQSVTYVTAGGETRKKGYLEMEYAMEWMDLLTDADIPWSINRGNHDAEAYYDEVYSVEKYGAQASGYFDPDGVAGSGDENMQNTYYKFTVNGLKYMIVSIDVEASASERAWANNVISANPDHLIIFTTHAYIGATGKYITSSMGIGDGVGKVIWEDVVSQHKNIFMVLSGHSSATDIVHNTATGVNGNLIHQVMIDESQLEYYGSRQSGVFALMKFSDGGDRIDFNYYSASEGKIFRSANQFTLKINRNDYIDAGYASKSELIELEGFAMNEFKSTNTNPGIYGNIYPEAEGGNSNLAVCTNQLSASDRTYAYVYAFDVPIDGIFEFGESAYVQTTAAWTDFAVYVIDGDSGITKRLFPKDSSAIISPAGNTQGAVKNAQSVEYFLGGGYQSYNLKNIGGLRVNAGDKIYVNIRFGGICYASVSGQITDNAGNVTMYDAISAVGNTASIASSNALSELYAVGFNQFNADGTPKNFNGWTVGWYKTIDGSEYAPHRYTLTVTEESGKVVSSRLAPIYTVLPDAEKAGHVFIGYNVDGKLYPANSLIKLENNTTAIAIFVEFSTLNAGQIRVDHGSGLKFSTFINMSSSEFQVLGASVTFGTLIAKADEITVDGTKDYSLLTKELTGKVIDLVSTVQVDSSDYTVINGSLVNFKPSQHHLEIVARGYMTITYFDGTIITLYSGVTDNSRTVAAVAEKALNDISKVKTDVYRYSVDGGYSCYDEADRSIFSSIVNS